MCGAPRHLAEFAAARMNVEPPLIELEGIGRRYHGKHGVPVIALRNVSLRLHAG